MKVERRRQYCPFALAEAGDAGYSWRSHAHLLLVEDGSVAVEELEGGEDLALDEDAGDDGRGGPGTSDDRHLDCVSVSGQQATCDLRCGIPTPGGRTEPLLQRHCAVAEHRGHLWFCSGRQQAQVGVCRSRICWGACCIVCVVVLGQGVQKVSCSRIDQVAKTSLSQPDGGNKLQPQQETRPLLPRAWGKRGFGLRKR